jgi:ABC-type transport system involved in multi-copper enzyme maturation permease subunit
MTALRVAWVVMGFEWRRTMAWSRLAFFVALASFPGSILWLIRYNGGIIHEFTEMWAISLFILVPVIVCLLGLLLWATPVIQAEVEGKTWPYLVVRPAGKGPILLGKYAAAVLWTMLTGWSALSLGMLVLSPRADALRGAGVIAVIVVFSCLAYGSLFTLLGTVFLRRGMIVAVAYTAIEFVLRIIPSAARELTVQYHLQSLLVRWMNWDHRTDRLVSFFFDGSPAWHHAALLAGYAVVLLGAAMGVLRWRELTATTET